MTSAIRKIHDHFNVREIAYRVLDGVAVFAGWLWTLWLDDQSWSEAHMLVGAAAVGVFFLVSDVCGLYRSWRGVSLEQEVGCSLLTWIITLVGIIVLGFATRVSASYPRRELLAWALLVSALLVLVRLVLRIVQHLLRARGVNNRTFAVVGVSELGFQLVRNIEHAVGWGLRFVGFFDDRGDERTPDVPTELGTHAGSLDDVYRLARDGEIQIVYITFPMRAEERIRKLLDQLSDTTASVYIVPDFFVFEMLHSRWTNIGGIPAVSVFENPFYGIDGWLKRMIDFFVALQLVVFLAIPMLLIAWAIRRSSPGPIFFRQKRYGLDGREIYVWKFRTMRVCEDGEHVVQAIRNDPRVTPVGAFLRRTSLDELPQLFNVLDGSMSLVGPRPHANVHNEEYRTLIKGYMLRHKVKPGITGLAQVSGWRGETDTLEKMQKRVECDHKYIREWSLTLDVKILLRTLLVVFSRQNAY